VEPADRLPNPSKVFDGIFQEGHAIVDRISSCKIDVDLNTQDLLQPELDAALHPSDVVNTARNDAHHRLEIRRTHNAHPAVESRVFGKSTPPLNRGGAKRDQDGASRLEFGFEEVDCRANV
jgi:hypothetical protein